MKNTIEALWPAFFVAAMFLGSVFGFLWWRASIQAAVFKRQGVEMSTFEVLMGAKPVERVIQIK